MALTLYPYQREAVNAISDYFAATGGHPLVEIPTGGGKSLIIGTFIQEAIQQFPDTRIICLAHVPELLSQNYAELIGFWPDAPAGIYSAKLGMRQIHAQILFAGIQSIHRKAFNLGKVDVVLVDEAHLIPRKAGTMYRRFLSDLQQINPHVKFVGFSATLFRMDSGMLHNGDGAIFDDVCYSINIRELINDGYLCKPVSKTAMAQIDTSDVGTAGGEFIPQQLEAAALDAESIAAIADEILANSEGRNGILVFGSGVKHSTLLKDALIERGISCGAVFGDTPSGERKSILNQFKQRRIRAIASMNCITTGFNARHVDMIALARPTKSRGLYIQIIGRGTRNFPGKKDALVLDFGGNIARHGPIDDIRPLKAHREKEKGDAPLKNCPSCGEYNPISSRECEHCGFEFPEIIAKIDTVASTLDIMSRADLTPQWVDVTAVEYARHVKAGSPDSMKVTYQCGLLFYSEWICCEHDGGAKFRAVQWLKKRLPAGAAVPQTVGEALEWTNDLDTPRQIAIRPDGKFMSVIGYRYFRNDVVKVA